MKSSKIKIGMYLVMVATFAVLFMFTFASGRVAGGNEWGNGNTMREACANARAKVRMKCENPVMDECECSTFDPRSKWSCNVNFRCR